MKSATTVAMTRFGGGLAVVVGLFGLGACDNGSPTGTVAPTVASPAATTAATPTVPVHMQEHFSKAADMQKAVVNGDLVGFKAAAAWMAEHQVSATMPPAWSTGAAAMQTAAHVARDAADLSAAAVALGAIGTTCASCHSAVSAPKITVPAPPAGASGTAPHMQLHQWAVDTMWLGLMGPSTDAWVKGAEAMATAPLTAESASPQMTVSKEVVDMADAVHAQAQKARTLEPTARGKAWGEMLVTCTACHQAIKKP